MIPARPLFMRKVLLQIGEPGDVGKQYKDLRIAFNVTMTDASSPNEANIDVYGLNADSLAVAQSPTAEVRLLVGYDAPRQIFVGNPVKNGVSIVRQQAEVILRIKAQDGGRAYGTARVALSYSQPTLLSEVVSAVSKQLGLPTDVVQIDDDYEIPGGLTLVGPARNILDDLARSRAADWMIRDGAFVWKPKGQDTGEQAVVFSSRTRNLVGSPSPKEDGIEVKALIDPNMRPGKLFQVESADYNGLYVARAVTFTGDTHGNDFYVVVHGTPRAA